MRKRLRMLALFALILPILAGTLTPMGRTAEDPEYYVVLRGREITVLTGGELSAEELAGQCGYDPEEYIVVVTDRDGYTAVELLDALDVTVTADGETRHMRTTGGTVGQLLTEYEITVGEEDILSHAPETSLEDGMEIRIRRVTSGEDVREQTIAHSTKYKDSADLEKGKEKTQTQGSDGTKRLTYRVKYIDGVEVSRELISEETVTEPVDTVILRGTKVQTTTETKPASSSSTTTSGSTSSSTTTTKTNSHTVTEGSGVVISSAGEELSYSKIINIKAYAYTAKEGAKTASGALAQVGIVAMLRSTLPQGTRVYVETVDGKYTYGPAIVGDVPGGDIIDLYFETVEECYQFGVRQARVYVLE